MLKFISRNKSRNNKEEAPFGILGASTEHKNNLRVNPIVERDICFLLKIDQYYYD